ncbi:MAG: ArsC/Spx/MgsR family protein [Pseudomonadota bacterium]
MKLYGLKTCDTCRKALKALSGAGQDVEFVDVRQTPLSEDQISHFLDVLGPALLNTRSTTWRTLSEAERSADPKVLLMAHPALMKRPVIEADALYLGWNGTVQNALLG